MSLSVINSMQIGLIVPLMSACLKHQLHTFHCILSVCIITINSVNGINGSAVDLVTSKSIDHLLHCV